MRLPTPLRVWRLLPAYAINGIEVALGIAAIQLIALALAGPHVAALIVSGAMSASIADVPNTVARNWRRVSFAAFLSALAALVVDLLRAHPLALGAAVAAVAFVGMMTLAWGARAGAVSFTPILSMIFSMAVPPGEHELATAGWSACGSFAFLAWSALATAACQRRYRTFAVVAALRSAAALFRSRADGARRRARRGGEGRAAQGLDQRRGRARRPAAGSARPALRRPATPRTCRDIAILLRLIDLRDVLLASRLDADQLGGDAVGRAMLERVAAALRDVAAALDRGADHVRDDAAPREAPSPVRRRRRVRRSRVSAPAMPAPGSCPRSPTACAGCSPTWPASTGCCTARSRPCR